MWDRRESLLTLTIYTTAVSLPSKSPVPWINVPKYSRLLLILWSHLKFILLFVFYSFVHLFVHSLFFYKGLLPDVEFVQFQCRKTLNLFQSQLIIYIYIYLCDLIQYSCFFLFLIYLHWYLLLNRFEGFFSKTLSWPWDRRLFHTVLSAGFVWMLQFCVSDVLQCFNVNEVCLTSFFD